MTAGCFDRCVGVEKQPSQSDINIEAASRLGGVNSPWCHPQRKEHRCHEQLSKGQLRNAVHRFADPGYPISSRTAARWERFSNKTSFEMPAEYRPARDSIKRAARRI